LNIAWSKKYYRYNCHCKY